MKCLKNNFNIIKVLIHQLMHKWNVLKTIFNIIKVFYSPTDAQVKYLKNHFKIYIRIEIKTAPTCFGAVTPSSGSALLVLAKVTVVKTAN
jgi:hypothetical protein